MTTIHIPPAALEAGARAAMLATIQEVEPDARANDLTDGEYAAIARAAFVAMVEAWPGMHMGHQCSGCGGDPQIILPLTENPDDKT